MGSKGEARLEDSAPGLRDGNSQVSDKRRTGLFVEAGDGPVNGDEGSLAQCHVDTLQGERWHGPQEWWRRDQVPFADLTRLH